jgi:hypothetical protein
MARFVQVENLWVAKGLSLALLQLTGDSVKDVVQKRGDQKVCPMPFLV